MPTRSSISETADTSSLRDDMGKKIFFFDLDGTLLNGDKKITPGTMEALRRFTDAGNYFCINTGRALDSTRAVYNGLGLDFKGSFLCGSNGTQIYSVEEGKFLYKTGVELSLVPKILDLEKSFESRNLFWLTCMVLQTFQTLSVKRYDFKEYGHES